MRSLAGDLPQVHLRMKPDPGLRTCRKLLLMLTRCDSRRLDEVCVVGRERLILRQLGVAVGSLYGIKKEKDKKSLNERGPSFLGHHPHGRRKALVVFLI